MYSDASLRSLMSPRDSTGFVLDYRYEVVHVPCPPIATIFNLSAAQFILGWS